MRSAVNGTLEITLVRDEVMVLIDRVANTDRGTEDQQVIPYRLILKLGSLYLEVVKPESPATAAGSIRLTEAETWLLRAKVQSGDKMASDAQFGIRLLHKLYELLIAFDANVRALPSAQDDGPTMGAEQREALTTWQREHEGDDEERQPA